MQKRVERKLAVINYIRFLRSSHINSIRLISTYGRG